MSQSTQPTPQPKTWELSLYELHRTPQEAITDDTEIAISPRSLHSELMCPICLDMLRNTMTTKECLHRFCQECIITALRSGNKECPTCRKKLISKRSLRPDPNFDALIEKIYPNRDEYEAHQEKVLQKLKKHHNQQALTTSIEEGLKLQAQSRLQKMLKQQRRTMEEMNNDSGSVCDDNEPTASAGPPVTKSATPGKKRPKQDSNELGEASSDMRSDASDEIEEVELVFRPHPDSTDSSLVDQKETKYIKTTSNATVDHLSKYLAMRLALEKQREEQGEDETESKPLDPSAIDDRKFEIFLAVESDTHQLLDGTSTLSQIIEQYWKYDKPLELCYSINDS